jgi:hypothetical protein
MCMCVCAFACCLHACACACACACQVRDSVGEFGFSEKQRFERQAEHLLANRRAKGFRTVRDMAGVIESTRQRESSPPTPSQP